MVINFTRDHSMGKKIVNFGVCVAGESGDSENDYYGILEDIIEISYTGEPIKKCILFKCHWFDPTLGRGMKIHRQFGIVQIRHTMQYGKYDPFILAECAVQVYYVPYPERTRQNADWWVVMRTKARSRVDSRHTLQIDDAYQVENMSNAIVIDDASSIGPLVNDEEPFDDVDYEALIAPTNEDDIEDECEDVDDNDEEQYEDEDDNGDEDGNMRGPSM